MIGNIFWGLKWGLVFATGFSLIALAMTVLTGGEVINNQGVSLAASIALYWSGGVFGGIVLGLLRPLTRTRVGAALVGVIIMVPVELAIGLLLIGPISTWSRPEWVGLIFGAIFMGGAGGYLYWEPHDEAC